MIAQHSSAAWTTMSTLPTEINLYPSAPDEEQAKTRRWSWCCRSNAHKVCGNYDTDSVSSDNSAFLVEYSHRTDDLSVVSELSNSDDEDNDDDPAAEDEPTHDEIKPNSCIDITKSMSIEVLRQVLRRRRTSTRTAVTVDADESAREAFAYMLSEVYD